MYIDILWFLKNNRLFLGKSNYLKIHKINIVIFWIIGYILVN